MNQNIENSENLIETAIEEPDNLETQLIDRSTSYYISKFRIMRDDDTAITWNWSAFLFTYFWLLYRKMYRIGIGLVVFSQVLSITLRLLSVPNLTRSLISASIGLIFGFVGNSLYMQSIEKTIEALNDLEGKERDELLLKRKGVNPRAVILFISVSVLMAWITFRYIY